MARSAAQAKAAAALRKRKALDAFKAGEGVHWHWGADHNEVAQRTQTPRLAQMPHQSVSSSHPEGEEQKEEGWALELILPVIALIGLGGFTVFKQVMQKRQERDGYSSVPTATGMPDGIEDGDVALGTLATDNA